MKKKKSAVIVIVSFMKRKDNLLKLKVGILLKLCLKLAFLLLRKVAFYTPPSAIG